MPELLRKHPLFWAFAAVCVALFCLFIVLDRKAVGALEEAKADETEQQRFLANLGRGQYALSRENLRIAQANEVAVRTALDDFLGDLDERFTLPRRTMTPFECGSEVRGSIRELRTLFAQRDIEIPAKENFSFDWLGTTTKLPEVEEIPVIVKQLRVVNRIARSAANAYVTQFHALERLDTPEEGESRPLDAGGHRTALYSVSVSGPSDRLRTFINDLNTLKEQAGAPQVLLVVQRLSFDRPALAVRPPSAEQSTRSGTRSGTDGPPRPYQPGAMPPRSETPPSVEEEAAEQRIVPRSERVAFPRKPILKATLQLALLEFRGPESEKSDGSD